MPAAGVIADRVRTRAFESRPASTYDMSPQRHWVPSVPADPPRLIICSPPPFMRSSRPFPRLPIVLFLCELTFTYTCATLHVHVCYDDANAGCRAAAHHLHLPVLGRVQEAGDSMGFVTRRSCLPRFAGTSHLPHAAAGQWPPLSRSEHAFIGAGERDRQTDKTDRKREKQRQRQRVGFKKLEVWREADPAVLAVSPAGARNTPHTARP